MNNLDLFKMALRNLAKRKLRTSLTILSVIIGTCSIIIMVSLGVALDEKFTEEINNMGSITEINLQGYKDKITKDEIAIIKNIKNVEAITPVIDGNIRLVAGGKYVGAFSVKGIDPETMEIFGYKTKEGRILSSEDKNKNSIVFGSDTIYNFFRKGKASEWYSYFSSYDEGSKKFDIFKEKLKITTDRLFGSKNANSTSSNIVHKMFDAKAVGILQENGEYDYERKHVIYMPFESVEKISKEIAKVNKNKIGNASEKPGYTSVLIKADKFENVEDITKAIEKLAEKNGKEFGIYSQAIFIKTTKRVSGMIQLLLGAIGGISLLIAAIGIANTMIMSIYERTKEIGIIKVIGARVVDIKKLFLLEATLIGLIGGILGVTVSLILSYILNTITSMIIANLDIGVSTIKVSSIPFWLSSFSLVFSSLIGLISGYLPAKKAVKIEALKAIKTE